MRYLITILALLIFITCTISCSLHRDKSYIRQWAADKHIKVKTCERRIFNTGPYYITRDFRIYWADTSEGVYWFRFGWGRPDIYSGPDGKVKIQ